MNKILRYVLYLLAGGLLLAGAAVAYILFGFDPNTVKPQIERVVAEKTQRRLRLEGDIRLKLWPRISASVEGARWSEYRSDLPFVRLGRIDVDLAFWPLLQRRYVVRHIAVDRLDGQLTRYADGRLSIQDLLERRGEDDTARQPVEFDIDTVRLSNAAFRFDDRQQKRLTVVNRLNFAADDIDGESLRRLALSARVVNSAPVANAVIEIASERVLFPAGQPLTLEGLHLETAGAAAGYRIQALTLDAARLSAAADGRLDAQTLKAEGAAAGAIGTLQAAAVELERLQLAPGQPVRLSNLRAGLKGSTKDAAIRNLTLSLARGAFQTSGRGSVEGLVLHAEGDYRDYRNIKLDVRARGDGGLAGRTALSDLSVAFSTSSPRQTISARLQAPSLSYIDRRLDAPQISGTVDYKSPQQALNAAVRGTALTARLTETVALGRLWAQGNAALGKNAAAFTVDTPLTLGLEPFTVDAPALKLNATLKTPTLRTGTFPIAATGKARADLERETATAELAGRFDASGGTVKASLAGFDRSAIQLNAELDEVDLDRYLAPPAPAGAPPAAGTPADAAASRPLDLSALAPLNLEGRVSIGKLKRGTLAASKLNVAFDAGNGRILVPELSVNAFGGSMKGSLSATTTARPAVQIRQTLSGVDIGQMLYAFADLDTLQGHGNAVIDVTAEGAALEELQRTVNGTVTLKVQDGTWKGINLGKTLRQTQALLRGQLQAREAVATEQTDFSEVAATLRLNDGIAYNDDLNAKSPLFRLAGKGSVDLPRTAIDYVAQVSVVNTSKGQGGRELAQLEGLTVPVRIRGTFDKLNYTLDFANLVREATQARLEAQKKELEAQAQQQIEAARAEAQKRLDEEKQRLQQRLEQEKQNARQKLGDELKKGLGGLLRPRAAEPAPGTPPAAPASSPAATPKP